jgi:hypothetical protein
MSLKTKDAGIQDVGLKKGNEAVAGGRASNPTDGKLATVTKSIVAAALLKTAGTNRECL